MVVITAAAADVDAVAAVDMLSSFLIFFTHCNGSDFNNQYIHTYTSHSLSTQNARVCSLLYVRANTTNMCKRFNFFHHT